MIGIPPHADLADVLKYVEAEIEALVFEDDSSDATAYVLLDRLDQWPHLGVVISSGSTEDTDRTDGVESIWVQDEITVELHVQTSRTPGQREMRNRALGHERRIRDCLCSSEVLQLYRPTYLRTSRVVSPDLAWLYVTLVLRVERFENVRRVA